MPDSRSSVDALDALDPATALRESEAALRAREAQLEAVLHHLPVGVIIADVPTGRLLMMNERARAIWRHPTVAADDGVRDRAWMGFHPEDGRPYLPEEWPLARAVRQGEVVEGELIDFQRGDGTRGTMRVAATPVRDGSERVTAAVVTFEDVTAERERERAVTESEARFRDMANAAPVMLWVTEPDGACTFLNRAWLDFTGQRLEQGLGFGWLEAVHPDDTAEAERLFREATAAAGPFHVEYRLRRADGEYRWCVDSAAPRRGDDGAFGGYIGSVVDVHERRVAQERLASLFAQAPAFIAMLRGPTHVFELANPAYVQLVGHRDILGRPVHEALPEVRGQGFVSFLDRVLETGEPYVGTAVAVQLQRTPGAESEERFVDFVYAPLTDADGARSGVVAIGSDVTERVRAERAREAALDAADLERRRLESVLATLPVGVIVVEAPTGRVVYANEALQQVWRQAPRTSSVESYSVEWQGYHVVDGRATERPVASHEWPVARALQHGETVLDQLVAAARPDGTRAMVSVSAVPIHDASGQRVGATAVVTDVEAQYRSRAALEAARAAAEQANRAKSEFLAVMSHELRTPLNAIQGYSELMELGIHGPVTPAQQEALRRIQTSQRHLLGLVNGVLNYARIETGNVHYEIADVSLADVLATCEALVVPQARAKGLELAPARVGPSPDGRTLAARADREKLQQIVLNLLSNAVKFTEPGGRVALSATADDAMVRVLVEDTGVGIASDQLDRIFEPFVQVDARFTRAHEGVGLGLAISRDLARGMGGDLSASSVPGRGARFTLSLPRAGSVRR
jgi:PAS domain S-box-containing protein